MTIPEHPVVLATIKSKSEVEDGWKLELDIPEFKSQFPVLCTRVEDNVAAQLKPGQTTRVVLARQSIKKGRDGSPKSGNYYSDYYWGLDRVATDADAPTPAPAAAPAPQAAPGTAGHRDRNEASIEAQCAYKGAIELLVAGIRCGVVKVDEAGDALAFLTWQGFQAIQGAKTGAAAPTATIQKTTVPPPPISAAPAPTSPSASSPDRNAHDMAAAPKPDITQALFRQGWEQAGLPDFMSKEQAVVDAAWELFRAATGHESIGAARAAGVRYDSLLQRCAAYRPEEAKA